MGTVVLYRNVKIIIRTNDHEPPHIHAIRGDAEAKIEILSRKVHYSIEYSKKDLARIVEFVREREELLMEAWNEIHEKN